MVLGDTTTDNSLGESKSALDEHMLADTANGAFDSFSKLMDDPDPRHDEHGHLKHKSMTYPGQDDPEDVAADLKESSIEEQRRHQAVPEATIEFTPMMPMTKEDKLSKAAAEQALTDAGIELPGTHRRQAKSILPIRYPDRPPIHTMSDLTQLGLPAEMRTPGPPHFFHDPNSDFDPRQARHALNAQAAAGSNFFPPRDDTIPNSLSFNRAVFKRDPSHAMNENAQPTAPPATAPPVPTGPSLVAPAILSRQETRSPVLSGIVS